LRRISGVGNVNRRLDLAQILREFLGVGSTLDVDHAALRILRMFERTKPRGTLIDRTRKLDSLYVFEYLAGQIPFDDIGHVRLARLAQRLMRVDCFYKGYTWEAKDPGDSLDGMSMQRKCILQPGLMEKYPWLTVGVQKP
jgi:hypothetical protein